MKANAAKMKMKWHGVALLKEERNAMNK